jgi:hypothetical protein
MVEVKWAEGKAGEMTGRAYAARRALSSSYLSTNKPLKLRIYEITTNNVSLSLW